MTSCILFVILQKAKHEKRMTSGRVSIIPTNGRGRARKEKERRLRIHTYKSGQGQKRNKEEKYTRGFIDR
jgi:hypothetical protein